MPRKLAAPLLALAVCLGAMTASAAPPGEVATLSWCTGRKDCLDWTATAGATSYALYRGDAASLARLATGDVESCRVRTFAGTSSGNLLTTEPLPSDGLEWFLVAGRNTDGEGSVGSGTAGPRVQSSWGECANQPVLADDFAGSNGTPWSAPWTILADSAALADRQAGEGRWTPRLSTVGYTLARMSAPIGVGGERDVEVTYTIRFDQVGSQGIGFYVRQNGGYCIADNTAACGAAVAGRGYALFIHGGFLGTIGMEFWKEESGDEIQLAAPTALVINSGVRYRVRYRVVQATPASTFMAAKLWPEAGLEPVAWQTTLVDFTPSLQGDAARGGIGVDSFFLQSGPCNQQPAGNTYLDDVRVTRVANPMVSVPPPLSVAGPLQFGEGPHWRGDRLLYTDITADTIYQLLPPATVSVFRSPSQQANGLGSDVNGDLLACEIAARRLTRTNGQGQVSVVVSDYQGLPLNAPNDLAVRADGTIYFTDPEYLINGVRQQPFLNLFRLPPSGGLVSEWPGNPASDGPNGVALSPDERVLYMANTGTGVVQSFNVGATGSLTPRPALASGLSIPDGLCVDVAGNVYVTTWGGNDVRVYTPAGDLLGTILFPTDVTNCAFGGADLRTLFVTTVDGLWQVPMPVPGVAGWN